MTPVEVTLETLARFEVVQYNGMVGWFCRPCRHLGFIARDAHGDQSGLTLGEIADDALEHECQANYDASRVTVRLPPLPDEPEGGAS